MPNCKCGSQTAWAGDAWKCNECGWRELEPNEAIYSSAAVDYSTDEQVDELECDKCFKLRPGIRATFNSGRIAELCHDCLRDWPGARGMHARHPAGARHGVGRT